MTTEPNAVQPIPEGYSTVTPWIISRDTAKLLDSILARPEDHCLVTLPRRRPLLDADGAGAHPRGVAVVPRKDRHR